MVGVAFALGPEPTVNGVRLMASGPYDWLRGIVPGLDGLRVPRRAIIIALLALTVLASFGVRFLLERLPRRPGRALALLLCGLAVVERELSPGSARGLRDPAVAAGRGGVVGHAAARRGTDSASHRSPPRR